MILLTGAEGYGKITQTAGTRIQVALGGNQGGKFTYVSSINYTAGTTAHTLTLMRGQTRTTVNGAVAAGGTSLVLNVPVGKVYPLTKSDGATLPASGDVVCVLLSTGVWLLSTVASFNSTTNTLVLNTAVPTGSTVLNAAKIVYFGVAGDTWHANYTYPAGASATLLEPPSGTPDSVVARASYPGEPVVFDSNNASAQGTLNNAQVGYSRQ